MVLFLFVVMMLDVNFDALRTQFRSYLPVGLAVGLLVAFEMVVLLWQGTSGAPEAVGTTTTGNTRALGRLLYVDYVYPFELAAIVLLVAIVAAIALTWRRRRETKYQDPTGQIRVRREDRVRLLDLTVQEPAPPSAKTGTETETAATEVR